MRPKHPFDYDAFVHNMVIYAGSFEGSGSMLVFGSPYTRNAPLGTRMALTGGSDGDLVNRLRGWALAEGVRGTESPWESALFAHVSGACEEETFLGDAFFKDHVMDPCGDTFGVGVADHVMGSVLDGALVNVTDPRCFDVYMNTGEMGDADASGSTGPDSCHESWSIAVGSVLERKSIVAPPKESYIGNRDKVVAVEVGERKERRPRTASTPVEEEEGSPNVKVCDVISDNVVDEDGEEEARRRVKAQIRRDRNRAAAARSNQKKKAMNDALKAQLKESRDRAETLRDRETSLRQENLLLRKILGEMGKA